MTPTRVTPTRAVVSGVASHLQSAPTGSARILDPLLDPEPALTHP